MGKGNGFFGNDEGRNGMRADSKVIAVFDYDGTLAARDSFWPFLVAVAGWPRALLALGSTLVAAVINKPEKAERRSFIKERMIRLLLKGRRVDEFGPAIEKVKRWSRDLPTADLLREHYAKGHHVVIASGSLDIYLPHLLGKLPHHALICTEVESVQGVITGNTPRGNCVRARKAKLVAEYVEAHGPFDDSWGYGNLPHDLQMMELVKHRVIV